MRHLFLALCGALMVIGSVESALAQSAPGPLPFVEAVRTTKVEGAFGISVNSFGVDVNTQPHCQAFHRPCADISRPAFDPFGLDASLAINQSDRLAIVIAGHLDGHVWASGQPATRSELNVTRTLLAGARRQSDWVTVPGLSRDPSRFFAEALVGLGSTTATGRHPIVQIGGGVDSVLTPRPGYANRTTDIALRMSFDYRISLARGTDLRGWQFQIAAVIGPHR